MPSDIVIVVPENSGQGEVFPPTLTGNILVDTLNSLRTQRLAVLQAGASPSYRVDNHEVDWVGYLKYLDEAIWQVYKELAQQNPFEVINFGI